MKLHLPKSLLTAVLSAVVAGFSYAAPVIPQQNEIVSSEAEFLNASTSNIFFDGAGDVVVTEPVTKRNSNLYVRQGQLEFSGVREEGVSLGNLVVSGNNAALTFDNVAYTSTAALNHIGGVDGNGTLNITNGSDFDSDAEVFTIGVQGNDVGNGSEGSEYSNGAYDDKGNGRGVVNIIDSTAKLTYRHLQMGEGELRVENSSVTIGNKDGGSEYYKGFKVSLGMGENTNSSIKVIGENASLTIYASQNGGYLGGFSTNISDNSVSDIDVDGGVFSVHNPANADSYKYPEGRNGDTYIGFSFYGELDEYTKNATANINIRNGGTVNFENHTTSFGYAGMKENGTEVNVTLYDADSTLNIRSKDVYINEGVTIDNKGKIYIDTTYENNRMDTGQMAVIQNRVAMYGGIINNHEGATLEVENDIVIGEKNYGSDVEQKSVVNNDGDIIAAEITFKGDSKVSNGGDITATSGDIVVTGSTELINSGNLNGYLDISSETTVTNKGLVNDTTYLHGSDAVFNAADGSAMKKVFLNSGTFNVEGIVTLGGDYISYFPSEAFLVFSEGASLKMDGYNATLDGLTIKVTENGSRSSSLISVGADGSCSIGQGAEVVLSLTESQLTDKTSKVAVLFADTIASSYDASITVNGVSDILWDIDENSFAWDIIDGKTWITGTVNAVTNIVVDEEINLSESITDVADGTKRSITVENTTATLSGNNTHSGGTAINNAKVTVGSETALGGGEVYLRENAALDLGGFAIDNLIHAEDSTISGTDQYNGEITISGNSVLTDDTARAAGVTLTETGSLTGKTLVTQNFELRGNDRAIETNLSVTDGGNIVLRAGNALTIRGNLTIGKDVCITLLDGGYAAGDTLLSWTGTLTGDVSELLLEADEEFILKQVAQSIILASKFAFEQDTADVPAQGNWGIFTASRAFVSAVQGLRNNMGCIAGGRGTAWASLLGGMTDISGSGAAAGSDITLFGAAVGVDMKVGKRSSLGVAFGYTDGEVSADGLGDIDQETGHLALYGEHGLKKFADNSCLSLDWVAATGTTESKYRGSKWEQDSVQLNARLTWNKQVTERFSYNVFGGVEYFASESDRVQNCKSGSVQNLRGELGAGVRYVAVGGSRRIADGKSGMVRSVPGCERVVLYGEVSYVNDMVRNNPSIEVNGLRGSGANPGRQGAGVEAGANIRIGERWSANANYSFNAMDDSHEHILNIGASRTF